MANESKEMKSIWYLVGLMLLVMGASSRFRECTTWPIPRK